jgi:hypothetical protein
VPAGRSGQGQTTELLLPLPRPRRQSTLTSTRACCPMDPRQPIARLTPTSACCTRPRSVYPKTSKTRPQTPSIKQVFVLPTATFEFGPLLAGRPPLNQPAPPATPPAGGTAAGAATGAGAAPAASAAAGLASAGAAPPEGHPEHTARFKIANCGLFELHADFWLKSEGDAADPAAAQVDPGKASKKAPPASAGGAAPAAAAGVPVPAGTNHRGSMRGVAAPAPAVALWPRSMGLAVGEVRELRVTVYPQAEGPAQDVIMCRCGGAWRPWPGPWPEQALG